MKQFFQRCLESWQVKGFATIIVITSILLVCTPVILHLFSFGEMLSNTYAAILGVALTAIISWALLNGQFMLQAKKDLERDKLSKVYEEKLRFYQHFLNRLLEMIKANKIEKDDALELQFAVATLVMHTKPDNITIISDALAKILNSFGAGDSTSHTQATRDSVLRESLQQIVQVFREELYVGDDSKDKKPDEVTMQNALAKIPISDSVNQENPHASGLNGRGAEKVIRMLAHHFESNGAEYGQFNLSAKPEDGWIKLESQDKIAIQHDLKIQFALDGDGSYYFQFHWLFDDDQQRRRTYMALRALYGGGFNKWCWWNRLNLSQQYLLTEPLITDAQADSLYQAILTLFKNTIMWVGQFSLTYNSYEALRARYTAPQWDIRLWQNRFIGIYFQSSGQYSPFAISLKTEHANQNKYSLTLEADDSNGIAALHGFVDASKPILGDICRKTAHEGTYLIGENLSEQKSMETLDLICKAISSTQLK